MRKRLGADRKSAEGIVFSRKVVEGLKREGKYVWMKTPAPNGNGSRHGVVLHPMAWIAVHNSDLKPDLNRRMRTRMSGGVGGVRSNAALSRFALLFAVLLIC